MYTFIFQSLTFISFGAIVYLVVRALPRVHDDTTETGNTHRSPFVSARTLEKADVMANMFSEKILRRLKIIILRADNFVTDSLRKIKSRHEERNGKDHTP